MKGLAITSSGIEDVTSLETKETINAKTEIKKSCVIFYPKYLKDLCTLCYKSQSIEKILFLLDYFNFKNNDDLFNIINNKINNITLDDWLDKKTTFRVSSKKINNNIQTEELNAKTGEIIINKIKKEKNYKQKVSLENPDIIFFIYIIKNTCYFGIDFVGIDLHKRDYRVFTHPNALRATIAYSLLRIANYSQKELLLDPFCGSGTILIEAALFALNKPINFYRKDKLAFLKLKPFKKINFNKLFNEIDKKTKEQKTKIYGYDIFLHYIQSAKKNAKIAGIQKQINFSKVELDWVDMKFKKDSIDKIITNPPQQSQHTNEKQIEKIYNNLFYQAEYILKKQGNVTIIATKTELLKESAAKYKFKLKHERELMHGKKPMKIVVFIKKL